MKNTIYKVNLEKPDKRTIIEVANRLYKGELGILPSDTIYGFSCSPFFKCTIERLFTLKNWIEPKPMILLIQDIFIAEWMGLEVNGGVKKLLERLDGIPLTLVLPTICGYNLPIKFEECVAVRVVNTPLWKILFSVLNSPVFSTSVNLKDENALNEPEVIKMNFKDKVDFIVDGGVIEHPLPSTIVDFKGEKPVILREGYKTDEIRVIIEEIF